MKLSKINQDSANDIPDLWHTLKNTWKLSEIIAKEIANELGFKYPFEQQARALDWLQDIENPA